jgi:hypothetical protein
MAYLEIIPESIQLIKMSDEEYFSEKYKDYISNSKLSLINPDEGGSIEKFNSGFDNKYSDSFKLGSAIHNIKLQPEYYNVSDIQKPNGKLGIFIEEVLRNRRKGFTIIKSLKLASKSSNYYSSNLSENRIKSAIRSGLQFYLERNKCEDNSNTMYLSQGNYSKFIKCMEGLNNPEVDNTLFPEGLLTKPEIYCEYAILCECKITFDDNSTKIIKIKGKIDNFIIDHEEKKVILNDLKSTGKPANFFMGNNVKFIEDNKEIWRWIDGSFQKYHYYRQVGMYLWMLITALKYKYNIEYKSNVNIVVIETIPNFSSKVYPIKSKDIKKGLNEMKQLIIHLSKWIN